MINILEEVKDCKTIGISGHVRPDGDCAGSCLGMAQYLKNALGDKVRIDVFLGDISDSLRRCLTGQGLVHWDYATDVASYDAFICLDCEATRLGDSMDYFYKAKKRINIDHHQSNAAGSGQVNWVVPEASSTCELCYRTMEEKYIDKNVAVDLYIGIVTDTGLFQYSNTAPLTMEIAGKLMAFGFDHSDIARQVFFEKNYIQQQILGRALLESILFMDGRCIVSMIDRKTMQFYRALSKDMDGIVSQLNSTTGVSCAIFMYEMEPLTYKVSLRSNGDVDVAKVAERFGGGGHARAAGCTVNAPYHDIINNMSALIEEQLRAKDAADSEAKEGADD
ncbi:MAG: bifunctional oligoribonuclease/PAP phosphatase NrnA [Lachnospiraceae bacterium]